MVRAIHSSATMYSQVYHLKSSLFQWTFEEKYDLSDDEYIKWLHTTHPESIMNQTALAIENDTLGHANQGTQITHRKCLLHQQRLKNDMNSG